MAAPACAQCCVVPAALTWNRVVSYTQAQHYGPIPVPMSNLFHPIYILLSCLFLSPLPSHLSVPILSLLQLYHDPGPISISSPPVVLMLLPVHLHPVPTPSLPNLSPSCFCPHPSSSHSCSVPIRTSILSPSQAHPHPCLIPSCLSLLSASWFQVAPATPWALTPAPVGPSSATVTGTVGSATAFPMWRARAVTAAAPTSGTWPAGKAASLAPATPSTP